MAAKLSDADRDKAAEVVALFSVLIHAWLTGDIRRAADTQGELQRLGVQVRFLYRPERGQGVGDGQ